MRRRPQLAGTSMGGAPAISDDDSRLQLEAWIESASLTCRVSCSGAGVALSDRERDVLALVGHGKVNKEIGAELGISAATVAHHRKQISRKLGLHCTGQLVACAVGRFAGICRFNRRASRDGAET